MGSDNEKEFREFSERFLKEYFDLNPGAAVNLGLHEYDGFVADISPAGVEKTRKFYVDSIAELDGIEYDSLSAQNRFDHEIIRWSMEMGLFEIDEMQTYKTSPMGYPFMFGGINNYLSREYAPFDERLKAIISETKAVPAVLKNAKINLNKEVSSILCDYAKKFSEGYISFFEKDLLEAINEKSDNADLIKEYIIESENAVNAFKDYIKFIDGLSKSDSAHRIGKDKFLKMLKVNEQIDISLEDLKAMGEKELNRLKAELEALLDKTGLRGKIESIKEDHPTEENLISDTKNTLKELVDFIRANNVVNLPEELNCIVTEMPAYMKFGFAAMGTAGPFEKSTESFYYVSLPEKDQPEEKRKEWLTLFNYPTLKLISIHEAFPGHYTHFLNSNKYATKMGKVFMSYSYIEGWAHYTEEMMIDLGYGKEDDKVKLAMIIEALIRCCRYMVAIGIHAEQMSIDEATKFFKENALMAETTARQEAERGAFDPGYLNYTLGKIYLKDLKERYLKERNGKGSLKEFHDKLVAFGAPTWQIAEKYIFMDNGKDTVLW